MVEVYIWKPTTLSTIVEAGIIPDFGHVAMQVTNEKTGENAYISFWPEMESLLGVALAPFKRRETRHPATYEIESDPEAGYMQRPADESCTLCGLDEARILREWPLIRDSEYHLRSWNCSNVAKFLIVSAMCEEDYARIESCAGCSVDDLRSIRDGEDLRSKLEYLTTSAFIDCRPHDLWRMTQAYNEPTQNIEKIDTASEMPTVTPSTPPEPALSHGG
jgi:hypothetical protein